MSGGVAWVRERLRRPVRRPSRRVVVTDLLVAVVLAAVLVVDRVAVVLGGAAHPVELSWQLPLALLLAAVIVVGGRAYPLAAVVLTFVAALTFTQAVEAAFPVVCFLAGRRTVRSTGAVVVLAGALVAGTAIVVARGYGFAFWTQSGVAFVTLCVFPWLAGRAWRLYQDLVRSGWAQAAQLEREQQVAADRARLRERARIAGDMHDSLGHELSLLGVRAGALEVAPGLPDDRRAAVRELREGAAAATERLREIIGVLRDDADDAPTEPVHETVGALVDRTAASGVDVRLTVTGDPEPLAPMTDRAVYRIVQEALTNAAKHAPGTAVTVALAYTPEGVDVAIANAPPPRPVPAGTGGGYGLVGLRERARLAGGTLDAGPRPGDGYAVRARLPYRPVASGATPPTGSAARLADARRRVRHGVGLAVGVPVALAVLLGGVVAVQTVYVAYRAWLPPSTYAALRVGTPRTDLAPRLPAYQSQGDDDVRRQEREPAGARCEYYRAHRSALAKDDVYRLCFVSGRLAAKTLIRDAEG